MSNPAKRRRVDLSPSPPVDSPSVALLPTTIYGRKGSAFSLANPDPVAIIDAGKSDSSEADVEHCIICLQPTQDRTKLRCGHDNLCFECILIWTDQSRKCPLCSAQISDYLIHHIRADDDYQKHWLFPLRTSPTPGPNNAADAQQPHPRDDQRPVWGRRRLSRKDHEDALERAINKRRWIYRNDIFAKHVASNKHTRYRPSPTPSQFSSSPELMARATAFLRRELRVWDNLDVEFLTTFTISLMRSIDIRSNSAIKLLAEFLDLDSEPGFNPNAEHFAHEVYSYLRSPFRDILAYDGAVQYDTPRSYQQTPSPPTFRPVEPSTSRNIPPLSRTPHPPLLSTNTNRLEELHLLSIRRRHERSTPEPQSGSLSPATSSGAINPRLITNIAASSRSSPSALDQPPALSPMEHGENLPRPSDDIAAEGLIDSFSSSESVAISQDGAVEQEELVVLRKNRPVRSTLSSLQAHLGRAVDERRSAPASRSAASALCDTKDDISPHSVSDAPMEVSLPQIQDVPDIRRRRLLAKLAQEKRTLNDSDVSTVITSNHVDENLLKEKRLQTQARLRARLAAERRRFSDRAQPSVKSSPAVPPSVDSAATPAITESPHFDAREVDQHSAVPFGSSLELEHELKQRLKSRKISQS